MERVAGLLQLPIPEQAPRFISQLPRNGDRVLLHPDDRAVVHPGAWLRSRLGFFL